MLAMIILSGRIIDIFCFAPLFFIISTINIFSYYKANTIKVYKQKSLF